MVIYRKGKVNASTERKPSTKAIKADEEIIEEDMPEEEMLDNEEVADEGAEGDVTIEPEASDLLFEVEDVAELIAEITGEPVDVSADEESVEFAVGEDVFTVEAEGDEEILEATRRPLKNKRTVKASTNGRRSQARRSRPISTKR